MKLSLVCITSTKFTKMETYINWIKTIYGNIDIWIYPFLSVVLVVFFIYVGFIAYCVHKDRKKNPWRY